MAFKNTPETYAKAAATRHRNKELRLAEEAAKKGKPGPKPYVEDCEEAFRILNEDGEEETAPDTAAIPMKTVLSIVQKQTATLPPVPLKTRWSKVNAAIVSRDISEVCWALSEIAVRDLREKGFVEIESLNLKEILRLVSTNNSRSLQKTDAEDTANAVIEEKQLQSWIRRA